MSRLDGKRPDGLTLIPWQAGVGRHRLLPASRVIGYVEAAALEAGEAAEIMACRKSTKYVEVENRYIFQPIAV